MIICTLSGRIVSVEYKGKNYWFEDTYASGWCCINKDYQGLRRSHPRGAWEELKRLYDPKIKFD